jgi:hypothetical protein
VQVTTAIEKNTGTLKAADFKIKDSDGKIVAQLNGIVKSEGYEIRNIPPLKKTLKAPNREVQKRFLAQLLMFGREYLARKGIKYVFGNTNPRMAGFLKKHGWKTGFRPGRADIFVEGNLFQPEQKPKPSVKKRRPGK